jgi:hypothetical protein
LRKNKFKLPDYSVRIGKVVSINEATNPEIFSVFCVLSGKISASNKEARVIPGLESPNR